MNTITILAENINNCKLPDVEKKTNNVSIISGIVLLVFAAILFVLSRQVDNNLGSSTEVFFGVVAVCVALYMFFAQREKMVDTTTNSVVSRDRIYYNASDLHEIKVALANKSFSGLRDVRRQPDGNVQLVFYFSHDHNYIAAQVQKYEPFEYKPCSEIYVFRGSDAEGLIEKLKAEKI
ncbi:MAG: hypothetical protein MJ000_07870 [Bacteroidales bacterium]|nr:hypothetical protein [Bacteroidales bacterium]